MAELYVKVATDASEFDVSLDSEFPTISLTAQARQGRANEELIRRLSEILGERVGIVSGHRSRRKKIAVDLDRDVAMKRLEAAANRKTGER